MGADIVICDHGRLVEGTDSGHLSAVLKGMGYKVAYVPRCYEGPEDLAKIYGVGTAVILADPSVHNGGQRGIDSPFLKGLEMVCERTYAKLVLFALSPEGLGRKGILDKEDHPSIVKKVEEAHLEYIKALTS